MKRSKVVLVLGLMPLLLLVACGADDLDDGGSATPSGSEAVDPDQGEPAADCKEGEEITTESGLHYVDTECGTGEEAVAGSLVSVHYTGRLTNGKKFDSSLDRTPAEPFAFPLGAGRVIAGWDEGIQGMRVGGKRRLTIPPELAYGKAGVPGAIPANATLIFDVELIDVQPATP